VTELQSILLLTGAADLAALRRQPVLLGARLSAWARAGRHAANRDDEEEMHADRHALGHRFATR
jgi:hypothetical protein